MKIEFIKSPTGVFGLAYSSGEKADLDTKIANNLIKDGYAIAVESDKKKSEPKAKK